MIVWIKRLALVALGYSASIGLTMLSADMVEETVFLLRYATITEGVSAFIIHELLPLLLQILAIVLCVVAGWCGTALLAWYVLRWRDVG